MKKNYKKLSIRVLLGLGIISQSVIAMDAPSRQEPAFSSSSFKLYRSPKIETNEMLDKGGLKDVVYQAKHRAKNSFATCACSDCDEHLKEAKKLWKTIRNADTSTPDTKYLILIFFDKYANRLSPEMKQLINTIRDQEIDRLTVELLPIFLMDMLGVEEMDETSKMKRDRFNELLRAKMGIAYGDDEKFNKIIEEKWNAMSK